MRPPSLLRHQRMAQLEKEVVLVGVRDHLEVWNRQRWDAYTQQKQENYDEIAEKAFMAS